MRRLIFIVLGFAFLYSCDFTEEEKDNAFILKGQLERAENIAMSLEELTPQDLEPLDSIYTNSEGKFAYRQELDEASFFILRIDPENRITLLIEPGEVIEIRGDAKNLLATATTDGSVGSELMLKLNRRLAKSYLKMDSIADFFRESIYSPDYDKIRDEVVSKYSEIFQEQRDFNKQFVEENSKSLSSIIALNQYLGDRHLLTMSNHLDYFEKVRSDLSGIYPENKHVNDLNRQISVFKRRSYQRQSVEEQLAPGNIAPEVLMSDHEGNPVSLSSLEGKVVLIDFWASWCDLCREYNQKYKTIYEQYSKKGFEIYSISLDKDKYLWLNAIEEDDTDWIHVSDQRFMNSPAAGLYNVDGVPHNILIDRNRKIIAKKINPEQLEGFLKELLP